MKEYIDREALIKSAEKQRVVIKDGTSVAEAMRIQGKAFRKCVETVPTADVVEVVRCKDCKHLAVLNLCNIYAVCEKTNLLFEPFKTDTREHFCSYGERKEQG